MKPLTEKKEKGRGRPISAAICFRDVAVLETIYSCGLRISELCGLRAEDIDWNEQLVRVRQVAPDAVLAVLSTAEGNGFHDTEEGIGGIDLVLSRRDPLERIVEELAGRLNRA